MMQQALFQDMKVKIYRANQDDLPSGDRFCGEVVQVQESENLLVVTFRKEKAYSTFEQFERVYKIEKGCV